MRRRWARSASMGSLFGCALVGCQSLTLSIVGGRSDGGGGGSSTSDAAEGGAAPDARSVRDTSTDVQPPREGGSSGGDASADVSNAPPTCSGSQATFAVQAMGDANPNFTSGVATRDARHLFVFEGLAAPVDGGPRNAIYAQTFDPTTGAAIEAAKSIYTPGAGTKLFVHDVATAASGEIVLLYGYGGFPEYGTYTTYSSEFSEGPLHALFLSATDQGELSVVKDVDVDDGVIFGQAHVIWNNDASAFVLSWEFENGSFDEAKEFSLAIRSFNVDGVVVGQVGTVQTESDSNWVDYKSIEQGSIGANGNVLGDSYVNLNSGVLELSLVSPTGYAIGSPIAMSTAPVYSTRWVATAGMHRGILYTYMGSPYVMGAFIPIAPDGGHVADAGLMTSFSFMGSEFAYGGRSVGDGADGGVGVALLAAKELDFGYVTPNGTNDMAPVAAISHAYVAGDEFSISSFAGTFVLGLYDSQAHSVGVAESGCKAP